MSKEELINGLSKGHEYQWVYNDLKYSLLFRKSDGVIWFYAENQTKRDYPNIDAIVADGFDLVLMTTDNPTLDEF